MTCSFLVIVFREFEEMLRTVRRPSAKPDGRLRIVYLYRMNTRAQNERKFDKWEDLPNGGRRYWLDVTGRQGWKARYVKEVDETETTVRFWQEIYDDQGKMIELHEKYPVDK